jgi:hypothetical protein
MSLRLWAIERCFPEALRRRVFGELVRLTADAFGVPPPDVRRLRQDGAIDAFARFTRSEAERAIRGPGSSPAIRDRLYRGARALGARARRRLGVHTPSEAGRALRILYHAIDIDLDADLGNREIAVSRCAFSSVYTPEVCEFVSALDAGIVSGLTGGVSLEFTQRMTEGAPMCRARLTGSAR